MNQDSLSSGAKHLQEESCEAAYLGVNTQQFVACKFYSHTSLYKTQGTFSTAEVMRGILYLSVTVPTLGHVL